MCHLKNFTIFSLPNLICIIDNRYVDQILASKKDILIRKLKHIPLKYGVHNSRLGIIMLPASYKN